MFLQFFTTIIIDLLNKNCCHCKEPIIGFPRKVSSDPRHQIQKDNWSKNFFARIFTLVLFWGLNFDYTSWDNLNSAFSYEVIISHYMLSILCAFKVILKIKISCWQMNEINVSSMFITFFSRAKTLHSLGLRESFVCYSIKCDFVLHFMTISWNDWVKDFP